MVLVIWKTDKYQLGLSLSPRHCKPFFFKKWRIPQSEEIKFFDALFFFFFRRDNCDSKNNE